MTPACPKCGGSGFIALNPQDPTSDNFAVCSLCNPKGSLADLTRIADALLATLKKEPEPSSLEEFIESIKVLNAMKSMDSKELLRVAEDLCIGSPNFYDYPSTLGWALQARRLIPLLVAKIKSLENNSHAD